jgi:predicted  nucleic acid-binding Zn-ribbon protein
MQHQASQLKGQITEEEDRVLEIMGQIDALQNDIALKTARVESIEEEWKQTQQQLLSEKADLSEDLDEMGRRRDEILGSIDAAHVETYEKIRIRKQGVAVAKIEQGRCQGCRIAVPLSEQTQARAGGLVQCGSCGRVLCLG